MRKLLIVAAFFMFMTSMSFGQVTVEGININKLDISYCKLSGYNKGIFANKIVITVDYGQKFKWWKTQRIVGPNGKDMVFHTMIDALNFMEKNGWEYVNNYVISIGNDLVYQYLLKKKK